MGRNGEGSSRGVSGRRRGGSGGTRQISRGEESVVPWSKVEVVPHSVRKREDVAAGKRIVDQSARMLTSLSIRNDVDGTGKSGDGLGFKAEAVEEKDEEMGVQRLLRYAARVDAPHLSQSEFESIDQPQEDELLVLQAI